MNADQLWGDSHESTHSHPSVSPLKILPAPNAINVLIEVEPRRKWIEIMSSLRLRRVGDGVLRRIIK